MATQHNFRIKNGLEVNGTVRISSAGLIEGTTTTQSASDNTTKLASTAYVTTAISNLVDGAPSTLNTLNEIAAALNDDAALNTTLTTSIAAKLPLAGGTMSGPITMSQSGALHNQLTSTGGTSKLSIISADGQQAYINYSGATNEMSAGYDRSSSEFRITNADTLSSNLRFDILSSTGRTTVTSNTRDMLHLKRDSSNGDSGIQFLNTSGNLTNVYAGSAGDFTIDTAGQINIDSGNSEIHLKSSGTTFGKLFTSGNDFYINQPVADEDIIFSGLDGSSSVAALTLDMSEAGRATFNEDVIAQGLYVGSRNASYDFYNNGTSYLNGNVTIDANLELTSTGWATATLDGATGGDLILQDNNVNIGEVYAGAGHGLVVKAHSGHGITFLTDGSATEKARILTTGEMGIGSQGPTADYGLSISKGGALGLRIKSDGQQGYTQGAISIESSVNTNSPAGRGQGVYMFNEANDITWYTGTLYNNASTYGISYKSGSTLQHAAADNGNAGVFMVIKNNGKVGIGTTNPTNGSLHVVGDVYSTTRVQGGNTLIGTQSSMAVLGSNSASVGIALARDFDATTYPDLVITSAGAVTVGSQGNVIGAKWLGSHENLYWNSKFVYSGGGYGSAPDKWITQGGNVTITSEHPYNKGFSTSYTNVQSASHTTNINNATQSTPHWKGVYTTFSGATNFGGNQNSSIGGGWESGEGAIMKCVYNGSGASGSTNAIRGYQWKNFFSAGAVQTRQSFFYFLESGEFSSGYFAGYAGQYGSDYTHGSTATESSSGQHRHTTTGQWVYVNHACQSYLGATFNNSSQNYMHGFGFRPGYATTVWIAVPGLTAQVRDDGKTINIHSAQQQIGQG